MMTKSVLLATALTVGTMAQTTSVMNLLLDTSESGDITYHGSVISAAPDATTYSVVRLGAANCTSCGEASEVGGTYVNGPSTFARHITEVDVTTLDVECNIADRTDADCKTSFQGPSADPAYQQYAVLVWASSSLTPVTITAGLEKILAASTAASGTAQTAASGSSGPSETGASASATSSSSDSTTTSGAANGAGQNVVLAAICGVMALFSGL